MHFGRGRWGTGVRTSPSTVDTPAPRAAVQAYPVDMATGAGKSDNGYEWQSWPPDSLEGMPPKRRRLTGWAIFWFIIVGSLLGSALEAFGVPEPWRSTLVAALWLQCLFL